MEFESAMERTFMPYIRTQLEIFDMEGGFSALPVMGITDANDSEQGEDAPFPHPFHFRARQETGSLRRLLRCVLIPGWSTPAS
jgi:hypothetical protein